MSKVFQMSLSIRVSGKLRQEALSLLRPLLESTRVLPDCISIELLQDQKEAALLSLIEEWSSRESLLRNVRSDEFRIVFAVMEMSMAMPEIRFREIQDLGGLDWIEKARREPRVNERPA